jgi:hypothetical protein
MFSAEQIDVMPGATLATTGDMTLAAADALGTLATPSAAAMPVINSWMRVHDGTSLAGHHVSLIANAQLVSAVTNAAGIAAAPLTANMLAEVAVFDSAMIAATGNVVLESHSDVNATIVASAQPIGMAEVAIAVPIVNSVARGSMRIPRRWPRVM